MLCGCAPRRKSHVKNLAITMFICAISSLTTTACTDLDLSVDDTSYELRAILDSTTPVTQSTCKNTQETIFARLSAEEQRVLGDAADLFNEEQKSSNSTFKAGCQVSPGSVSCNAFGYVCWVQTIPGGPGEPDVLDYGCGEETC